MRHDNRNKRLLVFPLIYLQQINIKQASKVKTIQVALSLLRYNLHFDISTHDFYYVARLRKYQDMLVQNVHCITMGKVNWKTRRLYIHPFHSTLWIVINTASSPDYIMLPPSHWQVIYLTTQTRHLAPSHWDRRKSSSVYGLYRLRTISSDINIRWKVIIFTWIKVFAKKYKCNRWYIHTDHWEKLRCYNLLLENPNTTTLKIIK